jgi:hypothetical protein
LIARKVNPLAAFVETYRSCPPAFVVALHMFSRGTAVPELEVAVMLSLLHAHPRSFLQR